MRFAQTAVLGFALCLGAIPGNAGAIVSLTGSLNPNDSGDVFVFEFTASNGTSLLVQSYGYGGSSAAPGGTNAAGQVIGSGGFDTYLSLFAGTGPSATFLASNDDGICPPAATDGGNCYDSRLFASSLHGDYTLVLSVSGNSSFAENQPALYTLGDGFIGLQQPDYYDPGTFTFRTSNWALDLNPGEGSITAITGAAPEPAGYVLGSTGILFLFAGRFLKSRKQSKRG
jgi:hypothetical protein